MKFYHGTNNFEEIEKEGFLWGKREAPSRCTYLAVDKEEARQYGKDLLEVDYDPYQNPQENNYCADCWQFRVYEKIPLANIKKIS